MQFPVVWKIEINLLLDFFAKHRTGELAFQDFQRTAWTLQCKLTFGTCSWVLGTWQKLRTLWEQMTSSCSLLENLQSWQTESCGTKIWGFPEAWIPSLLTSIRKLSSVGKRQNIWFRVKYSAGTTCRSVSGCVPSEVTWEEKFNEAVPTIAKVQRECAKGWK